jgi:hypothetical protein
MPPLHRKNYFDVLAVEEMKNNSSALTDVSPVPETARTEKPQTKKPRKSKLEKRLPKKLSVKFQLIKTVRHPFFG